MAIESSDYELIKHLRNENPNGKKLAILGDCHVHAGIENLSNEMKFETIETFDVMGNPTHKLDLNEPLDEKFMSKYDWVIDSGTLYCCFDIATVMKNILYMLKDDGKVLHTGNLVGFFGRGFFSLSPALFNDFYSQNGFEVGYMGTKTKSEGVWNLFHSNENYLNAEGEGEIEFAEEGVGFVSSLPNDSMICCFAKRKKVVDFTKPIPTHFVRTDGK
tara:strand:- start:1637 stop:2287 length:651 start_codon:yes stop_codon:yes gene_type:complete